MQGTRVDDFISPHLLKPGEYSKVPEARPDYYWPGHPYWHCCTPNGQIGMLVTHTVFEHDDRTITVTPSILVTGGETWHGYLEHGVWRAC